MPPRSTVNGWRTKPPERTLASAPAPTTWRGTPPTNTAPAAPKPAAATPKPAAATPKPAPADAKPAPAAPKPTTTTTKPPSDASTLSRDKFMKLGDDDFMKAVRDGKLPQEVLDSKDGMLAVQARMQHITEMNQLMTSMLQAIHQMRMGVIQNLRV